MVASSSRSQVPNQSQTGATSATLADSVRGTPLRQTHYRSKQDMNYWCPFTMRQAIAIYAGADSFSSGRSVAVNTLTLAEGQGSLPTTPRER